MSKKSTAGNGIKKEITATAARLANNMASLQGAISGLCSRRNSSRSRVRIAAGVPVDAPACTDGETIHLPVELIASVSEPGKARALALGFITHELGHCNFTPMAELQSMECDAIRRARTKLDTKAWDKARIPDEEKNRLAERFGAFLHELGNCAEDPRIEHGMCEVYGLSARSLLTIVHREFNPSPDQKAAILASLPNQRIGAIFCSWVLTYLQERINAYDDVDYSLCAEYERELQRRMKGIAAFKDVLDTYVRDVVQKCLYTGWGGTRALESLFKGLLNSKNMDRLLKLMFKEDSQKSTPKSAKGAGSGSKAEKPKSATGEGSGSTKKSESAMDEGSEGSKEEQEAGGGASSSAKEDDESAIDGFQKAWRRMAAGDAKCSRRLLEEVNERLDALTFDKRDMLPCRKARSMTRAEALKALDDPFAQNNGDPLNDCNVIVYEDPDGPARLKALIAEHASEISSLGAKLRRELVSMDAAPSPECARHGTRLARSQIPVIARGGFTRTPFAAAAPAPAEKVSIVLLCDTSGSMAWRDSASGEEDGNCITRFDCMKLALALIGGALAKYESDRLKLSVLSFDSRTRLVKRPRENLVNAVGRRLWHPSGDTEGYVATVRAAKMLVKDAGYRKVIITITDGCWNGSNSHDDPDDTYSRCGFGFLKALGIEDYGIRINNDFNPFEYDGAVTVDSRNIAPALGDLFVKILRKSKQAALRKAL